MRYLCERWHGTNSVKINYITKELECSNVYCNAPLRKNCIHCVVIHNESHIFCNFIHSKHDRWKCKQCVGLYNTEPLCLYDTMDSFMSDRYPTAVTRTTPIRR